MSFKRAIEAFRDFEPLRRAMENNDVTTVLRVIRDLLKQNGVFVSRINGFYIHNSNKVMVVYSYPLRIMLKAGDKGIELEISELPF